MLFTLPDYKTCRILVVDDVADNRFLLQTILESEGYIVNTAESGRAALTQIAQEPPDLILLDVMMPDLNGYEVARQIRHHYRDLAISIVLVTAHDEVSIVESQQVGIAGFIRKPIDLDQFLAIVQTYLTLKPSQSLRELPIS